MKPLGLGTGEEEGTSERILAMHREYNTQDVMALRNEPRRILDRFQTLLVPMQRRGDVPSRISNDDCNAFVTILVRQSLFHHGQATDLERGTEPPVKRPRRLGPS